MPCVASRRTTIITAVEAHNQAHPTARLPRSAAQLLVFMFADQDVCCVSQQVLREEGFGKELAKVFRALVEAGLVTRQPSATRGPDTYRLRLEVRP